MNSLFEEGDHESQSFYSISGVILKKKKKGTYQLIYTAYALKN